MKRELYLWGMSKKSSVGDLSTRAKNIVDLATGSVEKPVETVKNPAAVALGRLGGLKGGAARAKSLTAKKRSEIARKAAQARWGKKK